MDWIKNFNRAIDYIEENIANDLNFDDIAKEANSSKFHFLRVFSILTNKTLGEYIRDRKLTIATQEVLDKSRKIIDIAQKFGYEDPGAFSKAFKRFHGFTPKQVRDSKKILKAAPTLKFTIDVKGEEKMDYIIEKKEAFNVIGTSKVVSWNCNEDKIFNIEKSEDGTKDEMFLKATSMGMLGIGYDFDMDAEKYRSMIAIEGNRTSEKLCESLEIPTHTWAIFPGKGTSEDMNKVWDKIYKEWFPATNYIESEVPNVERYLSYDYRTKEIKYEIWIPVELKN